MNTRMNKNEKTVFLEADWPAAKNIHAFSTTRYNQQTEDKHSSAYDSFNLALHVEDDPQSVQSNRQFLKDQLVLPDDPLWLEQIHGKSVVNAAETTASVPQADASYSLQAGKVCVVMTADCLPVLICNRRGDRVAAAHAGWRGLAAGVIESAIAGLNESPEELLVWLGPAIGPQAFEVGEEVRDVFIADMPLTANAFKQNRAGHYLADMYQLARLRLQKIGIDKVYGGEYCTYSDADHFYSFRRDGKTGRQASLIWFD